MAILMGISNAKAIDMLDELVDQIDIGAGGNGTLVIYDGTRPADVDTAVSTQDDLVTFDLPNPAFGAAQDDTPGAIATANAISGAVANDTGTATWFRVFDGDGNAVLDGNVGTSDADLILNDTAIVATATITINSWTITMPEDAS